MHRRSVTRNRRKGDSILEHQQRDGIPVQRGSLLRQHRADLGDRHPAALSQPTSAGPPSTTGSDLGAEFAETTKARYRGQRCHSEHQGAILGSVPRSPRQLHTTITPRHRDRALRRRLRHVRQERRCQLRGSDPADAEPAPTVTETESSNANRALVTDIPMTTSAHDGVPRVRPGVGGTSTMFDSIVTGSARESRSSSITSASR